MFPNGHELPYIEKVAQLPQNHKTLQQYDKKSNLKKACTAQRTLKSTEKEKTKIYSIHIHGEQCLNDFQCA